MIRYERLEIGEVKIAIRVMRLAGKQVVLTASRPDNERPLFGLWAPTMNAWDGGFLGGIPVKLGWLCVDKHKKCETWEWNWERQRCGRSLFLIMCC